MLLGFLAFLYTEGRKGVRHGQLWRDNIYLSHEIASPAVYGIFRPQIMMPAKYGEKEIAEITYILAHENTHIRRMDNLWRLLGFITACVYWFNPLSWLFLKLFLEDMELACDEKVLGSLDEKEKKAYASALVDCAEAGTAFVSAFGGAKIHKRIYHILSYKKISVFSTVCFIILAAAIACALLTNGV